MRIHRLAIVLTAGLAWCTGANASSGLYQSPEVVVVRAGYVLLVAQADATEDRWISLCAENPDHRLEFDVRGLERVGHLFDSSLREEWGANIQFADTMSEAGPTANPDEAAESSMTVTAVEAIAFQTAMSRDDGEVDYRRVVVSVANVDGVFAAKAHVRATPVTRDGQEIEGSDGEEFEIGYTRRERAHCRLPDLRVPKKPPLSD